MPLAGTVLGRHVPDFALTLMVANVQRFHNLIKRTSN